ncbi:MAG: adenylate/guanylate cyclase domain-containing protein, partial [Candidatus Marinimicrobia bacterium]|nr:adenylate/guanylate cyclase domain-containing protein [Candidatus Neomarinimicrobiota bacterium]
QKQILTPIIEEFNGILHKEMGDGLLFTFPTVSEAVKCGIKIQGQTKDSEDLNLRIGIHEGEVTLKDGDVLGDDVNVASRIEPFSAVGGIAISGKIQQNISSLTEFETKYIGKPKLKGVAQKVELYCITSHGLPQTD